MERGVLFRAVEAGLTYFTIIFAAGFVLGVARMLIVLPRLESKPHSETFAVLIELPIMLVISWLVSRWLIRRFDIDATITARAVMGGVAFMLLLSVETLLGVIGFGRSVWEHLQRYERLAELLGLSGQVAVAAFPALELLGAHRRQRR